MLPNAIAVVVPYYNELNYLRATLESCLAQTRLPDQLILVDNASTDGSGQLCREVLKDAPASIRIQHVREAEPGFLHALMCGMALVDCEFVAVWNADTVYPPHYFALCEKLFAASSKQVMALMARDIYAPPDAWMSRYWRYVYHGLGVLRPKVAFTGSYGQVLRTAALRACGGYSDKIWPYTMEDHEVIHRLCKLGSMKTHPNLWCRASDRRKDRSGVNWTLFERLLYFFTPHSCGDWFFYRFLAPRFARRKMFQINLRSKDWTASPPSVAAPHVNLSPADQRAAESVRDR